MTLTLTLPDDLEQELAQQAKVRRQSVETVALGILQEALKTATLLPSIGEIVATVKSVHSNPLNIRPAQGSLAKALREAPTNSDFDPIQWARDWATIESELHDTDAADDVIEGRE